MHNLIPFIHENWYLVLLLIILILAYLVVEFRDRNHGVSGISPQKAILIANREKARYVDVRSKEAFDAGHIVDATNAPAGELVLNPVDLKKWQKHPVIVVCEKGISAKPAAAKLKKQGLDVYVLEGGLTAWRKDQMPVVKS